MGKIKKELKNATFIYDEEKKYFIIGGKGGEFIKLDKIYAFAFMRFVVRMAQRNWLRPNKAVDKICKEDITEEQENQLNLFENE